MNDMLKVESMEFSADIAGALDETRLHPKVVVEVISAIAKIITAAM